MTILAQYLFISPSMQLSPDKEYTGVYAAYPALPSSEAFLQKVSAGMKELVENDHLLEK